MRLPQGMAAPKQNRVTAVGVNFDLEPLFRISYVASARAEVVAPRWQWYRARPAKSVSGVHPWDLAHAVLTQGIGMAARGDVLAEPDLEQQWVFQRPRTSALAAADVCVFDEQVAALPHEHHRFAWHLDDDYSQLGSARVSTAGNPVRIAHLDTGYDARHKTFPAHVTLNLQKNFVDGQAANDAHDPGVNGILKSPGHGTGTLGLLAGNAFTFNSFGYSFNTALGGAPDAEIVPVRVGNSVLQILTSSVAQGIHYAAELCNDEATRIHVLSMSMGGVASQAWADAVNMAYDAGIVLVTAAGNNISAGIFGFPAHSIVYPARFRRVIAACGVMANRQPYYDMPFGVMQGNWGPDSKMATAMSAFTPNTSWAQLGCENLVDMDGAGTSSSAPQIAAAAALYLQEHVELFDKEKYSELWMRVEAVRNALFTSADKSADMGRTQKLGNGVLRAAAALKVRPAPNSSLHKSESDSPIFPFLRVLTEIGIAKASGQDRMLALEATQLVHQWQSKGYPNPLELAVPDPDQPAEAVAPEQVRRFLDALIDHPAISRALQKRAQEVSRSRFGKRARIKLPEPLGKLPTSAAQHPAKGMTTTPLVHTFVAPEPAYRCLRGFALDPSLATTLEMADFSEVIFKVPWEKLTPGPVGQYLEVVDVDPASGCFYEPVDLEDPKLLAQNGLAPSEGIPQFHQQMVYAVSSLTIRNFERALGRRVLWRPGPSPDPKQPKNDSIFVPRLRIYPHALREPNAYYSPEKIGLLCGYFNASEDEPGDHLPGSMVFTCLSHDVVAHETTHAILDGMHRQFLNPSNPDVLALHEAFADLVALFQHFTFPEILRQEIASTRGEIRTRANLLGQLARQFGRATGMRGALRDAIGKMNEKGIWEPHVPDPAEYQATEEPHARGAILVAAVFDAFLSILERRTGDLLRIATDGTGILKPGAVHPDLVNRLSEEAAKAAGHVLTMCIRALDYSPPADITFGEYLRAIITADVDVVADDDLHYRVAFIEAFRKRGIYPLDVRTLSIESLLWRGSQNDFLTPSRMLQSGLARLRENAEEVLYAECATDVLGTRERIFNLERFMRYQLHEWLREHFAHDAEGQKDASYLGLDPTRHFEVRTARFAFRTGPDGDFVPQLVVGLLQDRAEPAAPGNPNGEKMLFQGGATIIADLHRSAIRYCVRKNLSSTARLARQRAFHLAQQDSVRDTYFSGWNALEQEKQKVRWKEEPLAMLHYGF
jgi:hypothetical protein